MIGVGLGLSICKKLCEAMSGSISFKTTYGQGTSFTFCIKDAKNANTPPIDSSGENVNCPAKEEKISATNDSSIKLKLTPKKGCVLVVDDEMVCGHIVKSYCNTLGVSAEVVLFFLLISIGIFWYSSY